MFLKNLSLKDFKGFDDLDLSFQDVDSKIRNLTLFIGQNGTGKSNILKAIAIVTSGSSAIFDLLHNTDDWIKFNKKVAIITATIIVNESEERIITIKIPRGITKSEILKLNDETFEVIDKEFINPIENYFVAGYGTARRPSSSGNEFSSNKERYRLSHRTAAVYTLFNTEAQLNSISSWAMSLDYNTNGKGLDSIKNTLNYFLDGYKFHAIDKDKKTLLFKEGKNIISLESMSDGYQNMAAWIGDLLFRLSDFNNNQNSALDAKGILLIDEIDLHLHPKWQRKLLSFIQTKLPNMQVIATTHSPLVAQQCGHGELYGLKKHEGKSELIPFQGSPKLLLFHQILMSPVFGLETDESVAVVNVKEEYKKLKSKKNKTVKEEEKFEVIKKEINEIPETSYSSSFLSSEDMKMLKEIKSKLMK